MNGRNVSFVQKQTQTDSCLEPTPCWVKPRADPAGGSAHAATYTTGTARAQLGKLHEKICEKKITD